MRKGFLTLVFALIAVPADANETETGLPDAAAVQTALDTHPSVLAARARVDAARAHANALSRGSYEVEVTGRYDKRRVDFEGDFDEYNFELSRSFRLPGKAALDRKVGMYSVTEAENLAEDAKHQAALMLIAYWWDWLGAEEQARVDRQAVGNYQRALKAVLRRVELRDAAQLDADQSAAALASASSLAEQSAGRAAVARARLQAHFPALALGQTAPSVPVPYVPERGLAPLRELVLSNSHEIAAADARAKAMSAKADRDGKDRMADPTLGLRLFSERGGMERGAGFAITFPLGGGHRKALASQSRAEASAAQADAQLARFLVRETADTDLAEARYRYSIWQRVRESLSAQMAALEKQRTGYSQGEIDLADLLLGERMVHDAFRSESEARTAAMRAITRLRIDSHQLWLGD